MTVRKVWSLFLVGLLLGAGAGVYAQGSCPEESGISEMISGSETVQAAGPFDISRIKSSGAFLKKNGTVLGVYLSNGDFTITQMENNFIVPIKENGIFILAINFSNAKDPIAPGSYSAESGYGKPFWAIAEIKVAREEKGAVVSLGVKEGTASIVEISDSRVCGTFDLKLTGKDGGIVSRASGVFNVPLEISRW